MGNANSTPEWQVSPYKPSPSSRNILQEVRQQPIPKRNVDDVGDCDDNTTPFEGFDDDDSRDGAQSSPYRVDSMSEQVDHPRHRFPTTLSDAHGAYQTSTDSVLAMGAPEEEELKQDDRHSSSSASSDIQSNSHDEQDDSQTLTYPNLAADNSERQSSEELEIDSPSSASSADASGPEGAMDDDEHTKHIATSIEREDDDVAGNDQSNMTGSSDSSSRSSISIEVDEDERPGQDSDDKMSDCSDLSSDILDDHVDRLQKEVVDGESHPGSSCSYPTNDRASPVNTSVGRNSDHERSQEDKEEAWSISGRIDPQPSSEDVDMDAEHRGPAAKDVHISAYNAVRGHSTPPLPPPSQQVLSRLSEVVGTPASSVGAARRALFAKYPNPDKDLAKHMKVYRRLHDWVLAARPRETLAERRYWAVVLPEGKLYRTSAATKNYFWFKCNRLTTVETIRRGYGLRTLSEDVNLLLGQLVVKDSERMEELDFFSTKTIVLRTLSRADWMSTRRRNTEGLVPPQGPKITTTTKEVIELLDDD